MRLFRYDSKNGRAWRFSVVLKTLVGRCLVVEVEVLKVLVLTAVL